ncbi:Protein CBG11414 [Caenorhabditis briggsae]|uniref:Decapping nuclease n=1 Tax=Caenorhabditis briggsae TaxID=6238 RepID=A8XD30_CAEBR|nr:Protein CBG11414 [Caenorhabditis briggsae]CAP30548.2 Protein CBG11414 [Caenorhabditis briggsae]
MPVKIDIEHLGTLKKNRDRDEGGGDLYFSLFDYIRQTASPGNSLKEAIGADFISTRRNLVTLSASAFPGKPFQIRALRKDGVIFICDRSSEQETINNYAGGYKFEQYMTLNENGHPHDDDEPVSNAECVKSVLRTTFESGGKEMKVFYAAELDAVDREENLVEFKSTNLGHQNWLERLSRNHYLQSYFGNVSYIIKGSTTREKIVFQLDKILVDEIPKMEVNWDPETCFVKLFEILEEVKTRLENDDEAVIIRSDGVNIYYEEEDANNCNFVDPEFLRNFY